MSSQRKKGIVFGSLLVVMSVAVVAGLPIWLVCLVGSAILGWYSAYLLGQRSGVEALPNMVQSVMNGQDAKGGAYEQQMEMARQVQQRLLSVDVTVPAPLKVAKKCIPAESIGGDFYTFINHDVNELVQQPKQAGVIEYVDTTQSYFGVVMGDVAGHGMSSALVMALSSGIFLETARKIKSPAKTLSNANMSIHHFIEQTHVSYVTVSYAVFNPEKREMYYARGGHPPAMILRRSGDIEYLNSEGIFLGMFEDEQYEEVTVQFEPGDRVFFYTDGLTEAANDHNEQFGLERVERLVKTQSDTPIDSVLESLFDEVAAFSGDHARRDDQTMVIVEVA